MYLAGSTTLAFGIFWSSMLLGSLFALGAPASGQAHIALEKHQLRQLCKLPHRDWLRETVGCAACPRKERIILLL